MKLLNSLKDPIFTRNKLDVDGFHMLDYNQQCPFCR
jgi:hypothetical protein